MIRRLFDSLFRPKLILNFLIDKIWYVISYILILFLIISLPKISKAISASGFSEDIINIIDNNYLNDKFIIKISDSKASFNEFSFEADGTLFSTSYLNIKKYRKAYIIEEDSISLFVKGRLINKKTYSDLGYNNLDLKNTNEVSRSFFYDSIYDNLSLNYDRMVYLIRQIGADLLIVMLFIILFMWLSKILRPKIKAIFRFKIIAYGMSWLFLTLFLDSILDTYLISLIGIYLSYRFIFQIFSSVVEIEVKQK
jgi:hypothetical protein